MHTYTGLFGDREVVDEALHNCARDSNSSRAHVFVGDKDACNVALQEVVVHVAHLHTSAYVNIRTQAYVSIRQNTSTDLNIRQYRSAYVSVRQHTSAYVSMSDFLAERHWDKL